MLVLLILVPVLAAAAIMLGMPARKTANGAAWANLLITLCAALGYHSNPGGFQEILRLPILPDWHLQFLLGIDGLSLMMLLLTAIVTVAAIWVTPEVKGNERVYFASLLFIAAGAMGAFTSLDLFFFYAFHELALIPTFLLIGIWGTGDRQAAAWKITIYLAVGSFILLLGLLGLYLSFPVDQRTFDITVLQQHAAMINPGSRNAIYLALLFGFGILISLFPFHTWAPTAYASAPTPAAMMHAGVLKKFGLYGLLRVALPLLPESAHHYAGLLLVLLLGNILYAGLATIGQKRLDLMLGYSSVMHMGYIFLGIASFNLIGTTGAALLMFAHGLSIAALFAIAGQVRERTGTMVFSELGGLAKPMPILGFAFGLAAFASIGLPGFANFASEILVFFGAFSNGTASPYSQWQITTLLALWGVVISAVYMMRGYRAVFQGAVNERWAGLKDVTTLRWPIILLLAVLLLAGFFPGLFIGLVKPVLSQTMSTGAMLTGQTWSYHPY
jgi:NADH-quinone oxidoreductase subunit M